MFHPETFSRHFQFFHVGRVIQISLSHEANSLRRLHERRVLFRRKSPLTNRFLPFPNGDRDDDEREKGKGKRVGTPKGVTLTTAKHMRRAVRAAPESEF